MPQPGTAIVHGTCYRQPPGKGLRRRRGIATIKADELVHLDFPVKADELVHVDFRGVIYTSVLNPRDGRKNWSDMLTAFCYAHSDRDDATLILKFVHHDGSIPMTEVRDTLARLPAHKCRVVAVGGFLEEQAYRALIAASTFIVNSSLGEGQCLPLMEGMSYGKPVIAPRHTAMSEYVDKEVGFVVDSSEELVEEFFGHAGIASTGSHLSTHTVTAIDWLRTSRSATNR
jgi:glycosyltransferase involved in cell wall biosynthesis